MKEFNQRKINLQLFAEADDEPKVFTQEDVDRIVGERLGREKGKYADYEELKELESHLEAFGYTGTAAEKKAALKAQAEAYRKEAELEALKDEANKNGTSPELLAEIKALKDELKELKKPIEESKKADEAKQAQAEAWQKQQEEFGEKFPDIDLQKLAQNERFMKFLKRSNPNLTISEVYEDFVEMVGNVEAEAIAKTKANIDRSTSSGRNTGAGGGTYGLTDRQQTLAKENGMTNKEYADYLKHIS